MTFNRFSLLIVGAALITEGCCNIGCKYDMRKYPTPICQPSTPRAHVWNPDCGTSDLFDKVLPPGYTNTANPSPTPAPLPKGPTAGKVDLMPPAWNDPNRGGIPAGAVGG